MKVTKTIVKEFETQQKDFGTQKALQNIIWILCASLLKDLGVKNIKTTYHKK